MDSLLDTFQRSYSSFTTVVSEEALITLGILSIIMFAGTIVAIPIILNRLPSNYFQHDLEHKWMKDYHPIFRNIGLVLKNTVGLIFLLAGIAMLVLPGQGIFDHGHWSFLARLSWKTEIRTQTLNSAHGFSSHEFHTSQMQ